VDDLATLDSAIAVLERDVRYRTADVSLGIATARSLGLPSRGLEDRAIQATWATDLVQQVANDLVDLDREFRRALTLLQPPGGQMTWLVAEGPPLMGEGRDERPRRRESPLPRPAHPAHGGLALLTVESGSVEAWLAPVGALYHLLTSRPLEMFLAVEWFWEHRRWLSGAKRVAREQRDPTAEALRLMDAVLEVIDHDEGFSVEIHLPDIEVRFHSPPRLPRRR
jgi:hypothetical protein